MKTTVKSGIYAAILFAVCIALGYIIWSNPGT